MNRNKRHFGGTYCTVSVGGLPQSIFYASDDPHKATRGGEVTNMDGKYCCIYYYVDRIYNIKNVNSRKTGKKITQGFAFFIHEG